MRCDECGFDYESLDAAGAPAAIRAFGKRYRAPLTRFLPGEDGDTLLRTRPGHGVWSALEYAAHVGDVFAAYDERVRRSLVEDRPVFEPLDPDEAAREGAYNDQDPREVTDRLVANSEHLAATLEAVPADGWDRVGIRQDEEQSVLFIARRAVHEGNHHLLDLGRVLRTVREQAKEGT